MSIRSERVLYVLLAVLWLAITGYLTPLTPGTLLLLSGFLLALWGLFRIEAQLPDIPQPRAGGLLRTAVVALTLVTMSLFTYLWNNAGGFFSMVDIGESHSIYATAWNIHDWVSLILQDVATGPDPDAHPYWYIHHPNFFSRMFAFTGILLGANLETLVLLTLGCSALSLVLIYHGMSRQFSPVVGVASACFVAVSYGVFYKTAGDLLRAFHPIMFWGTVYLLASNPGFSSRRGNILLALLSIVVATGDWAFFVFWVTFVTLWTLYRDGDRVLVLLLRYVYAPVAASLFFYFLVVIYAVGWDFFVIDILVTYFGKVGTSLIAIFNPRDWSYGSFLQTYREHNVVLWDMATHSMTVRQLLNAYRTSMDLGSNWLTLIFVATYLAAVMFVVLRLRAAWWVKLIIVLLPLGARIGALPDIAYGIGAFTLALHLPTLRVSEQTGDSRTGTVWLNVLLDLTAWLTALLLSLYALGTIFPNYANWLFGAPMPPALFAEAGGFGLLCLVLVHFSAVFRGALDPRPARSDRRTLLMARSLWLSWRFSFFLRTVSALIIKPLKRVAQHHERSRVLRSLGALAVGFTIAGALGLQVAASYERYRQFPPSGPPYHAFLSQERFRGKSVLATTYDAVAWYSTKGWAYISASNPPKFDSSLRRFRHFADWNNDPKYLRPDLVLCDNSRYHAWARPAFPGREQNCLTPGKCDCRDVAAVFLEQGHRPLISNSEFSIIEMRYDGKQPKEH
jgi:hypothetical protein